MPAAIPIIVAAVGSGIAGGTVAGVIGFSMVSAMIGGGLALAGSLVSMAMTKKPSSNGITATQHQLSDRSVTVRQPIAARRLVYGMARLGGVFSFLHTNGDDNEYFHIVITLSGKKLNAISYLRFDGELIPITGNSSTGRTAGFVEMYTNFGEVDQPAIAALMTNCPDKWTVNHRQRSCAHVYLKLKADTNIFPHGLPNITFDVLGYDGIYDPRSSSYGYTTNAALCQADYLHDATFGLNAQYGSEIVSADLIEAANICDEDVALAAGGTEDRYTVNGIIDSAETPKSIIESLLTASSGAAISLGNLWYIHAGAYRSPVMDLTANDLVGPIKFQTRHSRTNLFNAVQGTFVSPANGWQPADFPPVKIAAYVAEDNDEEIWKDAQLLFTISETASQRIVRNQIEINRRQINGVIQCRSRAWEIKSGENFRLTLEKYGWVNKVFTAGSVRLVQVGTPPALVVEIDFAETDSSVWGWTTGHEAAPTPAPTTTLPTPFDLPAPSALAWSSADLYSAGTGTLSWTAAPSAYVDEYEVEYLPPGASIYLEHVPVRGTSAVFDNLAAGEFGFRVRARSHVGTYSAWAYLTQDITIPAVPDVTGLVLVDGDTSTTFTGGTAKFAWAATSLSDRPGNSGAGPWFASYQIEIVKGGTVVHTAYPLINSYEYTYEQNSADGGPDRAFTVRVYVKGDTGMLSASAASLTVSNPAPTMAGYTPDVVDVFQGVAIVWSAWSTTDADQTGFAIYCDTASDPTTLIDTVSAVSRRFLITGLIVGTNYKVKIIPIDAFGPGVASEIGNGTPLTLTGVDVNVELSASIVMTDADGSTSAQLATLYDRVVDSGGITYSLTGAAKFIRYQFGLVDYIDKVILHVGSTPCQCYVRYSADGLAWSYLEAEADHTLTASGELVAGTSGTAPTNYWQTVAGLNVAVLPARVTAQYCELVMVGSYTTTIFELMFVREIVAEQGAFNNLSSLSQITGDLYSDTYEASGGTEGFRLNGPGAIAEFRNMQAIFSNDPSAPNSFENSIINGPAVTPNLVRRGFFNDYTADQIGEWTAGSIVAVTGVAWAKALQVAIRDTYELPGRTCTPGEWLYTAAALDATDCNYLLGIGVCFFDVTGTALEWGLCGSIAAATGWTSVSGRLQVPVDAVAWCPWIFIDGTSGLGVGRVAQFSIYRHEQGATVGAPTGTYVGETLAQEVEGNAATALADSAAALAALTTISSDDVLSAVEKPTVVLDYTVILAEQSGIDGQATAYGITTEKTAYDNAVSALTTYLATLTTPVLWSNLAGETTIVGTTFRGKFADVYGTRQVVLNKIATVAGTRATWEGMSGTPPTTFLTTTEADNLALTTGWKQSGTTKIDGGFLGAGTVLAGAIYAANLYSLSQYTGALTVDNWLTIGTGGGAKCGKTAYGSGTGYLFEYNGGTPRLDIGDGNNYMRWSGSALEYKGLFTFVGATAGDYLEYSDTRAYATGDPSANTTYAAIRSVKVAKTGTLRFKFRFSVSTVPTGAAGTAYGKLYKNSSPFGTEFSFSVPSGSGVYVTPIWSEDLVVTGGDIISIYAKTTTGGAFCNGPDGGLLAVYTGNPTGYSFV